MFNPYIWILSLGHLVVDLGQGVLPVLTPILTEKLDLSFFQVGTVALAFTFSSAIIQPVFGVMSDRFSMPWLMPLGLFLSGFGLALTGLVNSYELLLFAVLLSGIGVAGYHPEGSKLTHLVSKEGRASSAMSVFSVGGNLGFGLGPMLAIFLLSFSGLDSIYGVIIPGLLVSLLFLFLLPRFKKILKEGSPKEKKSQVSATDDNTDSLKTQKRNLMILVLYVTMRSWMHAGLIYFIPFYFPAYKSVAEPEYLISIFLIAGVIGSLLGGPLADRFGRRNILLVAMVIALLVIYPFVHLSSSFSVFAFIVGASLISTFSITVVFAQSLFPNNIGLASGIILGLSVGTGSIGVSLLGFIADHAGLQLVMNIICLLPIAGIAFASLLPSDKVLRPSLNTEEIVEQEA